MKIPCHVVEDLLPLYHDNVCSKESCELVEEHLQECANCKKILSDLQNETVCSASNMEDAALLKSIRSTWTKTKKRAFLKGLVIAVVICAILIGGYLGLTRWKCIPVSADVLEVTELCQLPDGSVLFNLFVNDDKELYFVKYTTTDDGCLYVTPMHSIIEATRKYDVGGFNQYHLFNPNGADTFEIYGAYPAENVTKVYVGPIGEGTLVWEKGMNLPMASKDIEQMVSGNLVH